MHSIRDNFWNRDMTSRKFEIRIDSEVKLKNRVENRGATEKTGQKYSECQ